MSELTTYCLVDKKEIPSSRALHRSVTCSPECARKLEKLRRQIIDARRCRKCGVPSTPEERKDFLRWRRETGQVKRPGRPKVQPAEETGEKPKRRKKKEPDAAA